MFEVNNENRKLIEGLVSGSKTKEVRIWTNIYNVLKTMGIICSGVALFNFGVTVPFAVISSSIFTILLGIHQVKMVPAKKAKAEEDLAKQNFMLEIQSNLAEKGIAIDGRSFKLERTAVVDSRQPVYFKETNISDDGEIIEENKAYSKTGLVEKYVRGTDDRNGFICWLKLVRESVVEQKMLAEGNGYVSRVVPRYSVGMLESHEIDELPGEVIEQTMAYDGSNIEEIVGRPRIKSKN